MAKVYNRAMFSILKLQLVTDALNIYDVEMEYRSTLVYYDKEDRS